MLRIRIARKTIGVVRHPLHNSLLMRTRPAGTAVESDQTTETVPLCPITSEQFRPQYLIQAVLQSSIWNHSDARTGGPSHQFQDPILPDLLKLTPHNATPISTTNAENQFNGSINEYSARLGELLYLLIQEKDIDDSSRMEVESVFYSLTLQIPTPLKVWQWHRKAAPKQDPHPPHKLKRHRRPPQKTIEQDEVFEAQPDVSHTSPTFDADDTPIYPDESLSRILMDNFAELVAFSLSYFNLSLLLHATRFLVLLIYSLQYWEVYHLLYAIPDLEYFLKLIEFDVTPTTFGPIVRPPTNYLNDAMLSGLLYPFPYPFYNYLYHSLDPKADDRKLEHVQIKPYVNVSIEPTSRSLPKTGRVTKPTPVVMRQKRKYVRRNKSIDLPQNKACEDARSEQAEPKVMLGRLASGMSRTRKLPEGTPELNNLADESREIADLDHALRQANEQSIPGSSEHPRKPLENAILEHNRYQNSHPANSDHSHSGKDHGPTEGEKKDESPSLREAKIQEASDLPGVLNPGSNSQSVSDNVVLSRESTVDSPDELDPLKSPGPQTAPHPHNDNDDEHEKERSETSRLDSSNDETDATRGPTESGTQHDRSKHDTSEDQTPLGDSFPSVVSSNQKSKKSKSGMQPGPNMISRTDPLTVKDGVDRSPVSSTQDMNVTQVGNAILEPGPTKDWVLEDRIKRNMTHECQLEDPVTHEPCLKLFYGRNVLLRHQEFVHAAVKKVYSCIYCFSGGQKTSSYLRHDSLARHIKRKHGVTGKENKEAVDYAKEIVEAKLGAAPNAVHSRVNAEASDRKSTT